MPMLNVSSLLSFILLCLISGEILFTANAQRTWCVARPSSDQATLMGNINYACSQVDCWMLQRGSSCFDPDNLLNHASVAMHHYYQSNGRNNWNCDFKGSGLVVVTDPSYGNCIYG